MFSVQLSNFEGYARVTTLEISTNNDARFVDDSLLPDSNGNVELVSGSTTETITTEFIDEFTLRVTMPRLTLHDDTQIVTSGFSIFNNSGGINNSTYTINIPSSKMNGITAVNDVNKVLVLKMKTVGVSGDIVADTANIENLHLRSYTGGSDVMVNAETWTAATSNSTTLSDERLKTDIQVVDDSQQIDLLRQIQPITYRLRDTNLHSNRRSQLGFSADNLELIDPHLAETSSTTIEVEGNPVENVKKVKNTAVMSLCVSACKNLDSRMAVLESLIGELLQKNKPTSPKTTASSTLSIHL